MVSRETLERKRAICEFIKLKAHLSNYQIANALGVSESTVRRYRKELEAAGELEPITERLTSDGRVYSVSQVSRGISSSDEIDPFEKWFNNHVICGDMFDVLPKDPLKYDLKLEKDYNLSRDKLEKLSPS